MNTCQLGEVKATVRSLIQSQTDSFYTVMQLQKDYKEVIGHNLPLLGYPNVHAFLHSIPDVVKVTGYGPQAQLQYIPSSKSKHIGEMIKNQKQSTGRRRGKRNRTYTNRPARSERIVFPEYSDESDWEKPTKEEPQFVQTANNVKVDSNLDNCGAGTTVLSENEAAIEQERIYHNSRSRWLMLLRKKYGQERASSSSTNSSEAAIDLSKNECCTTTQKRFLEKIKPNEGIVQPKSDEKVTVSRFMQLTHRERPTTKYYRNKDEDEAIPANAVTDIIERMNSTGMSQVASEPIFSELSIPQNNIHKQFKVGDIFKLSITEIDNPLLFYFILGDEENDLLYLHNEMQTLYNTLARGEQRLQEHNLCPDAVCAAFFNGSWHRAVICSVPPDPNEFTKIKIFLVDRGIYCELSSRHLKFLSRRFSYMTAQAICGRLANIKPGAYTRESPASILFKKLVQESNLYGYVKSIGSRNQQVELILLDFNFEQKRRIKDELIKAGVIEEA